MSGSSLPWLTAFTLRCPSLELLDVSDGGALVEATTCLKPGDREVFILRGDNSVKVAGWVVRAEVMRLKPALSYRSGVRFAEPVNLNTLRVVSDASIELRKEFVRLARGLPGVHSIRVSSELIRRSRTEPVHFAVPNSLHGDRRVFQVFFAAGSSPTTEQFIRLKHLAVLASGLPDLDIVLSDRSS